MCMRELFGPAALAPVAVLAVRGLFNTWISSGEEGALLRGLEGVGTPSLLNSFKKSL